MPLLKTTKLEARYGDFQALFGIDFEIHPGEIVAMIGANGAGKSTFLKTVCGLLKAESDAVVFDGEPIGGLPPGNIVRQGIAMVPEGRRLFPSLSVEENLLMGAYAKRPGPWNLDAVYTLFPLLKERRRNPGTALSGGQQQMVAIGRALMSNPKLLICDEISLGPGADRGEGDLRRAAEHLCRGTDCDHRRAGRRRRAAGLEPAVLSAGGQGDADRCVEAADARADIAGVLWGVSSGPSSRAEAARDEGRGMSEGQESSANASRKSRNA